MAGQKVGDIYVDLSVHIKDAKSAGKDLANAFKGLGKSSLSLKPRLDTKAVAKSGQELVGSLKKSFDSLGKINAWQKMGKDASAALKTTNADLDRLQKHLVEVGKSTAQGKKYFADLGKGGAEAAQRAEAAWLDYLSRSKAASVVAARAQIKDLQSVQAAQRSLASQSQSVLSSLPAKWNAVSQAMTRFPVLTRAAGGSLGILGTFFDGMARDAERAFGRAGNAAGNFSGKTEKAFGVVRFMSYQAIIGIERMVGAFVRAGFEAAKAIGYTEAALEQVQVNIEKAAVGFDNLGKAQQKALEPKIMDDARKKALKMTDAFVEFSQETPYALDQIQEIGQQLLITRDGLKESVGPTFDLIKVMRSLGDISAATGKGVEGMRTSAYVLQQIGQSGEIMGDDLRQLHNAIPNWKNIIASQMGMPVQKLTNDVAKSKEGITALFKGLNDNAIGTYSDVLKAQNDTLPGQFQRMVETINNGVGRILLAFEPSVKPILHSLGNFFSSASKSVSAGVASIQPQIQSAMKGIGDAFSSVGDFGQDSGLFDALAEGAQKAIPAIGTALDRIKGYFQAFGKSFSENGGVEQFKKLIDSIKSALKELWPTVQKIGKQISDVLGPAFSDIGKQIATQVLPALSGFIKAATPVANFLLNVLGTAVVGVLKGAVNVIKGVFTAITGILNVFSGIFTGNWGRVWTGLKQIVTGALQAIWGVIQVWLNGSVIALFRGGFLKLLPSILKAGWIIAKGIFKGGLTLIVSIIRTLPGLLMSIGRDAMGALRAAFLLGRVAVVGLMRALPRLLWSAMLALPGLLRSVMASGFSLMKSAARVGWEAVKTVIKGLITRLPSFLLSAITGMNSIGIDIVRGIASGIGEGWHYLQDALSNLKDKAVGAIKGLFEIGSPSRVMAKEVGKWIPAGIAVGITSNTKTVTNALTNLAIKVGKQGERVASSITKRMTPAFVGLAKSLDTVNTSLKTAQKRLSDLQEMRKVYTDIFLGFADLNSLGQMTDASGNQGFSFSKALDDITKAKEQALKIADLGKQAIALGVNQNTLDAILNLGADSAQNWLQGIVSGGKSAASQVSSYFSALSSAGTKLGDSVLAQFQKASVSGAQAYVNALLAKQATLQSMFMSLATKFANDIIKALNSSKGGYTVGYGPAKKTKKKAIGSMSWGGGPVSVGEHGREIVDLPPRSRIHTAHASERMLDDGPVELSDESIQRLADAILSGSMRVSVGTVKAALSGVAVGTQ